MLRALSVLVVAGMLACAFVVGSVAGQTHKATDHAHEQYVTQLDDLKASRNLMIVNVVALLLAAVAYGAMMQVLVGFRARFADHSDVITEHTATLAQVTGDLRSLGEAIERIQKAERFSTVEGQIESLRDLIRELVREKSKD
jgi:hypothetical protein